MNYKAWLEKYFQNMVKDAGLDPEGQRLRFLAAFIFDLTSIHDPEQEKLFGLKALELCAAITGYDVSNYRQMPGNYQWVLSFLHMVFFDEKIYMTDNVDEVQWSSGMCPIAEFEYEDIEGKYQAVSIIHPHWSFFVQSMIDFSQEEIPDDSYLMKWIPRKLDLSQDPPQRMSDREMDESHDILDRVQSAKKEVSGFVLDFLETSYRQEIAVPSRKVSRLQYLATRVFGLEFPQDQMEAAAKEALVLCGYILSGVLPGSDSKEQENFRFAILRSKFFDENVTYKNVDAVIFAVWNERVVFDMPDCWDSIGVHGRYTFTIIGLDDVIQAMADLLTFASSEVSM